MIIQVTRKTNTKLLNYFPIDPYSDIIICSTGITYQLQISFLLIQSKFFQDVFSNKQKIVDLSNFNQIYLDKVLRALYGDELIIKGTQNIIETYKITDALKIEEYKNNIIESLLNNLEKWNKMELIQICYQCGICLEYIRKLVYENNFNLFFQEENLKKICCITSKNLIKILQQFLEDKGSAQNENIVIQILDNYFKAKQLFSQQFFSENFTVYLADLWKKYRPKKQKNLKKRRSNNSFKVNELLEQIKTLKSMINQQKQTIKRLQIENSFYKQDYYKHNPKPPKLIRFYSEEENDPLKKDNQKNKENEQKPLSIVKQNIVSLELIEQNQNSGRNDGIGSVCSILQPQSSTFFNKQKTTFRLNNRKNNDEKSRKEIKEVTQSKTNILRNSKLRIKSKKFLCD